MLGLKDPGEPLSEEELKELLRKYEEWLKSAKKMTNYEGAKKDRENRKKQFEELLKEVPKPRTLTRIGNEVGIKLEQYNEQDADAFQDIAEFLQNEFGIDIKVSPKPARAREEEAISPFMVIGRVAPTIRTPATPTQFCFWVKDDDSVHLEIGSIVSARFKEGNKQSYVTGIVSDIQALSDMEGVLDSFYAHAFGQPEEEMPTRLPIIMNATVEVVRRSDGRTEPIRGTWPVTFATAQEIRQAYSADIPTDQEVLAGFTYDGNNNPVPITLDARYVMGYEAAHINIAGASGVATKTSYALFLLFGLLAYNRRYPDSVAVIAFNVKEADLMFIDRLPSWENIQKWKISGPSDVKPSAALWLQSREEFSLDPIRWAQAGKFRFYAPKHYNPRGGVLSQRENVEAFTYSLPTLIKSGVGALYSIFDPEDLDDKALALISSIADKTLEENFTFGRLFSELEEALKNEGGRQREWFTFGKASHHKATGHKILNRIKHAVENQLRGVILRDENTDHPIPVDTLHPGELWVIDITQLSDKGQRLIFQTVVRTVYEKLKERKSQELTGNISEELRNFPKRVVIFVDELNKFVPSGREYSAIKRDIVEMAARGRSIGMALIGAEQLASKVDEEVLANTSTFAVGRSHAVEIHKPPYAWLTGGLKEKAMMLDKGQMLLWHTLHKRPVLVHFPLPLHRIYERMHSKA